MSYGGLLISNCPYSALKESQFSSHAAHKLPCSAAKCQSTRTVAQIARGGAPPYVHLSLESSKFIFSIQNTPSKLLSGPQKTPREGPAKRQKEPRLLIMAKVEEGVVDFPKGGHFGAQILQSSEILALK